MPSGHPGSTWQPRTETEIRLARWKRLAVTAMPVDEIAVQVGMTRDALDQMVCRARRHNHPDAILHPDAGRQGLRHLYDSRDRRARILANSTRGAAS